jgi:pSer/pThr/pTyr-binding forkhead associated (FHA) protein
VSVPPTQVITVRKRELLVRTLRLEVVGGPDRGKSVETVDELSVGTDRAATLVLDDPTVSRLHFAIRPRSDGWLLSDLGSTNGTEVAGVRVIEAIVAPGQTISIGGTSLQVVDPGSITKQPLSEDPGWGRALGKSAAMRALFAVLPRIATSDAVVLLEGETGSGKTLLADAIHRHSARRDGAFVVLDCRDRRRLSSPAVRSREGAFTGAHAHASARWSPPVVRFSSTSSGVTLEAQPSCCAHRGQTIRRVGGTTVSLVSR